MLFTPGNFNEISRWIGLAILSMILIFYIEAMCALYVDGWSTIGWLVNSINILKSVVGLLIIVLLFALVNSVVKTPVSSIDNAFPSSATIWVGLWLFIFALGSIIGVYLIINPKYYGLIVSNVDDQPVKESLIVLFASGMGSSITTMLGYLSHASEKKDFDIAFVPWYFARPLMGMILGLIFYFALKGGILVLTIDTDSKNVNDFNDMALAAVGALVGMFSKNAIEKLRDVFNTLFSTDPKANKAAADPVPAAPVVVPVPVQSTPVTEEIPATPATPAADSSTPKANGDTNPSSDEKDDYVP